MQKAIKIENNTNSSRTQLKITVLTIIKTKPLIGTA